MLGTSIPNELLSDHLFLLVGTNPLPNWVAAKLLLKPGGCVHLVYTSGVEKQMERMRKVLENHEDLSVSFFKTADSDEAQIFEKVSERAKELKKETGKVIGLNYTGGTKMMSVHAHRALHSLNLVQSLSYLDARSLSLKFDRPANAKPIDIALSPEIRITLEKLLRLHEDFNRRGEVRYSTVANCAEAAQGLMEMHRNYSGQHTWNKWCEPLRKKVDNRKLKYDLGYYRQIVTQFDQKSLPQDSDIERLVKTDLAEQKKYSAAAAESFLKNIVAGYQKMLAELRVTGGSMLQDVVRQNPSFKDSIEFAKWLTGGWLEQYTFAKLEECREEAEINADGMAVNLESLSDEGREFEADVIALRGYQLFYLSCYTGSELQTAKLKLFEAMVRSSQLGGDEAKFALVSSVDKEADLKRNIESNWQKSGQVEVFGRDSLPKLKDKLRDWFNRKPKTD